MAATDARPVPIKNTAFRVTFPIMDNDGDLVTGAAGLDSEISKDNGTFGDCTNEAIEIATASGMYYLDLTFGEMNADTVAIIVKTSTTDAKTTSIVMYPEELGDVNVDITAINGSAVNSAAAQLGCNVASAGGVGWNSGCITTGTLAAGAILDSNFASGTTIKARYTATASAGAATSITFPAGASAVTDFWKGHHVTLTSGTAAGQTRLITAYNGGTRVATISPVWATNPDGTSVFVIDSTNAESVAGDITGNLVGNITGNLSGSVGSVTGAVGSVTGNVGGNVVGSVGSVVGAVGSVTGNVSGSIGGSLTGSVGSVLGNVGGSVVGNVNGSVASVTGSVGSVIGSVGGNVLGSVASVAGHVLGNVQGGVIGNLGGSVVGSVLGDLAGNVIGTVGGVQGNIVGNINGNLTGTVGSVAGNVIGDIGGSLFGNVNGNVLGTVNDVVLPVDANVLTILGSGGGAANLNTMSTAFIGMIIFDSPVWQFTANALELGPSGGGGGGGGDVNVVSINGSDEAAQQLGNLFNGAISPLPSLHINDINGTTAFLPPTVESIGAQVDSVLTDAHGAGPWTSGPLEADTMAIAEAIDLLLTQNHGNGSWQSYIVLRPPKPKCIW